MCGFNQTAGGGELVCWSHESHSDMMKKYSQASAISDLGIAFQTKSEILMAKAESCES
jgi:hypothetical protein